MKALNIKGLEKLRIKGVGGSLSDRAGYSAAGIDAKMKIRGQSGKRPS